MASASSEQAIDGVPTAGDCTVTRTPSDSAPAAAPAAAATAAAAAAAAAAEAANAARFPALTRVRIKGLVGAHELNATIGFVRHEAIEQGRVPIQCAGQSRSVRVKFENLDALPNQVGARVRGMQVHFEVLVVHVSIGWYDVGLS
jgi:hypothetical protein